MFNNYCEDCGLPAIYHIQTWLDELTEVVLPELRLSKRLDHFFTVLFERFFTFTGLIKMVEDFALCDIQARAACFIEEAKKQGVKFKVGRGPFGYTNHFRAEVAGKQVWFESLPTAEHVSKYGVFFVNSKERTKSHLKKGGFPVPEGASFWFWRKRQAIEYGLNKLGFPLVVKPRGGSVARHVTTDIKNEEDLKLAISKAVIYSPAFIVESFIERSFVHRATVVDFDFVACVKQVPANVTGDGHSTIQELTNRKNQDERRGEPRYTRHKSHVAPRRENPVLYKIVLDDTAKNLIEDKGYGFETIPAKNEVVYVQKDPFLKLGGDLVEVTGEMHPDNLGLFRDIARFFDLRLVGIDFIASDISRSWRSQTCAVLELNSLPCIEMHHFPSAGVSRNVGSALVDLFFKYYL